MTPYFRCVLSFFAIFYAVQSMASDPKASVGPAPMRTSPLQLTTLIESVDRHFPLIKSAAQDQRKSEADSLSAQGGFDPVLKSGFQRTPSGEYENQSLDAVIEQPTPLWGSKVIAGYRKGFGKFGPYDEKLKTNSGGEVRGGVEIPLLRGGEIDDRRARILSSEIAVTASSQTLELQKLDAQRQAALKYYDWVVAGEKLKVSNSLLQLARDRDASMKHRVVKGDVASIDQIDNERSVIQRSASVVSSTRSLDKSALELSLFYRDDDGRPIIVYPSSIPPDALSLPSAEANQMQQSMTTPAPDEIVNLHPELKRLRALNEQNEVETRLAQNMLLPKFDAEISVSQDFGVGTTAKETLEYKAGIKVELPLRRRTARGKLEGIIANRSKLDAQLELARDRIRISLMDYAQAIHAAKTRIAMMQQELALSTKVEQAERLRFRHGDSNLLMVNLREQATADARIRTIDALADYHKAVVEFELIVNRFH
ncbi:MAG: TolC family protein [Proteobacteria bacterium]|nr:TolC family protein [Pseudomonadota bacterium]